MKADWQRNIAYVVEQFGFVARDAVKVSAESQLNSSLGLMS